MFKKEFNYGLADQPSDRMVDTDFKILSIASIVVAGAVAFFSVPWAFKTFHTTAEVIVAAGGPPAIPVAFALGFNYLRGFIG